MNQWLNHHQVKILRVITGVLIFLIGMSVVVIIGGSLANSVTAVVLGAIVVMVAGMELVIVVRARRSKL